MKRVLLLILVLGLSFSTVFSKTKKYGTWVELEFSKEFLEKFEFSFVPEIRFQDDFTVDEYLFDGVLSYQPTKYLKMAGAYRINTNIKNKGNVTTGRFAFDVTGEKKIDRFEASLRGRFTNFIEMDADEDKGNFFRPRLKLKYNIEGNKITPFLSYELFRNITEKEFDKSRFDVGATRKFGKSSRIGIYYRLQDYFNGENSIQILGLEYRLKL